MADAPESPAPMWVGVLAFGGLGLKLVVQGILHTISGEPIPSSSWTDESTGPEHIVLGLVSLGFAVVVVRASRKPKGGG